jgi:uncharacterized repeat protein (TIGR03803 family)
MHISYIHLPFLQAHLFYRGYFIITQSKLMGKKFTLAWLLCLTCLSVFSQTYPNFLTLTSGYGGGTLSRFETINNSLTAVHWFTDPNRGTNPYGSLVRVGTKVYGLTVSGGEKNMGVIFSYDTVTKAYNIVHHFNLTNGAFPQGTLTLAQDGKLYGTTRLGGNLALNGGIGYGTLFSYDPASNQFARYIDFNEITGTSPLGLELAMAPNGNLWGMTSGGGLHDQGTLFVFEPATKIFSVHHNFNGTNGGRPEGNSLTITPDGVIWGTTANGGGNPAFGVLFSYDPSRYSYNTRVLFNGGPLGARPAGKMVVMPNGLLYGMTTLGGSNGVGVVYRYDRFNNSYAKTDFSGTNGKAPKGSLTLASNGLLYGVTLEGGSHNQGVVFSVDPTLNIINKLKDFTGSNGSYPQFSRLLEISSVIINNDGQEECGTRTVTIRGTVGTSTFRQILLNSRHATESDTTQPEIPAVAWTCGAFGVPLCQTRGLFRYDLTSIPQNAVIESATLKLFARTDNQNGQTGNPMFGTANTSLLQRVITPWTVGGTGWGNQPSTTTAGQKVLPQSTSNVQNYEVDLKDFVQTWVSNPAQNYGALLRLQTEQYYNSMVFQSGRAPDAQKPTLVIRYSVPTSKVVIRGTLGSPLFSQALLDSRGPFTSDTTQPEIPAAAWTCNSFGVPTCQTRGLFRYDVRGVPAGSRITSAKLYLYADNNNINGQTGNPMFGINNTSLLSKVTTPWNIAAVGWSNQPATTTAGQKTLPQSSSTSQDYVVDVTDFVQGWVDNPSSNYGMLLKLQTEQFYNSMVFHSGQAPDALKPRLEICYGPAGTSGGQANPVTEAINAAKTMPSNVLSNGDQLHVSPNPALSEARVQLRSRQAGKATLVLVDGSGNVIYREAVKAVAGNNIYVVRNLKKYAKGLYQVRLETEAGMMSTKLVVQ